MWHDATITLAQVLAFGYVCWLAGYVSGRRDRDLERQAIKTD